MSRRFLVTVAIACCCTLTNSPAFAKTLILEGDLDGSATVRQVIDFAVNQGAVSSFSFRFALPATFSTRTVKQSVAGFDADLTPRPTSSIIETDRYGNRFQRVTWDNINQDIQVALSYTVTIHDELTTLASKAPFPLGGQANDERTYLQETDLVQSNAPEISSLARQLTKGAKSEYEAVMAVTNWVADNIRYTFNPPQYDAAYTLATKSGNCQNFAHLSIALLRSIGIPARIVGGFTLKDPWRVPIDAHNAIVQSMGQGGHAWLEVWFPDLGWLPYDPQQSKQFTSTRHIKQSHGLDSRDINDTWRGAPYLPAYRESINGHYNTDAINLRMRRFDALPRPYLLSNLMTAASQPARPVPTGTPPVQNVATGHPVVSPVTKPVKPAYKPHTATLPAKKPPYPKPTSGSSLTFGNMEFPTLVNLYSVKGNVGTRIFERETSAYVSSQHIYAQAFFVKNRIALERISLAMHKFGGDGTIYIDLVKDKEGRPDIMQGIRSNLLDLEKLPSTRPGYYWVDFSFPPDGYHYQQLAPGKYWIVFRSSGEAIMNWFFIPGKPYSGEDDTRSTAKGFRWEDILNCDFVFKVTGKAL